MSIKSFKELEIWKRSIGLVEDVYLLTKSFPSEELYGLTAQIRKSVVSIPSNITESFARLHNKEYKQFLYVSLGSCAELTTQLLIASKLNYTSDGKTDVLLDEIEQISKMTMSLIKKLNTKSTND